MTKSEKNRAFSFRKRLRKKVLNKQSNPLAPIRSHTQELQRTNFQLRRSCSDPEYHGRGKEKIQCYPDPRQHPLLRCPAAFSSLFSLGEAAMVPEGPGRGAGPCHVTDPRTPRSRPRPRHTGPPPFIIFWRPQTQFKNEGGGGRKKKERRQRGVRWL